MIPSLISRSGKGVKIKEPCNSNDPNEKQLHRYPTPNLSLSTAYHQGPKVMRCLNYQKKLISQFETMVETSRIDRRPHDHESNG